MLLRHVISCLQKQEQRLYRLRSRNISHVRYCALFPCYFDIVVVMLGMENTVFVAVGEARSSTLRVVQLNSLL